MKRILLVLLFIGSSCAMDHKGRDIIIHLDHAEHTKELKESTDSTRSNGAHSHLKLAIVSAITGLTASAITAAVTLAIHFSSCNANKYTQAP